MNKLVVTPEFLIELGGMLKAGASRAAIAEHYGVSKSRINVLLRTMGAQINEEGPKQRRKAKLPGGRRIPANPSRGSMVLADDHEAIVEGRTLFRNGDIRDPGVSDRCVLISGKNNSKLGGSVTVGRFAGRAIYHLSLEERATCPRACEHWKSCYGNGMHLAARHKHGPALEDAIRRDVPALLKKHKAGILVRLHTLGDFYSLDYVRCWAEMLKDFPKLAIWGYTRRRRDSDIGEALWRLRENYWGIFSMRFSELTGPRNSFVLKGETISPRIGDAFVCKQEWASQQGDQSSLYCGNCAACWESNDPVVFVEH